MDIYVYDMCTYILQYMCDKHTWTSALNLNGKLSEQNSNMNSDLNNLCTYLKMLNCSSAMWRFYAELKWQNLVPDHSGND